MSEHNEATNGRYTVDEAIQYAKKALMAWTGKPMGDVEHPFDRGFRVGHLRTVLAEVERLRAALEWRPIETAPKDGTRIRIRFASGNEYEASWRTTYGGEWHVDDFHFLKWADQHLITNWAPLPNNQTEG